MVKDFQTYINEGLFDRNQSEFSIRKTDRGIEQVYIPKTKEELYSYIDLDIEQAKKDGTYPNVDLNNIDVSELGDDVLKDLFGDDIYMINPDISTWNIKSIPNNFFNSNEQIKEFTIPNSVTSIGSYAFEYCSNLTSVTIPNSVTSIGFGAFKYCSSLTSVTIPNNVTSIGGYAFYYCSSLTSVVWNAKNCTDFSYGGYAPFNDINTKITSFTFGSGVEHIPANLCYGMENLTSVTIPNSVTSIGEEAFYCCSSLESVIIPNGVTRLEDGTFAYCSDLTSVTIPSSVTSIGKYAFWGCPDLKYVTISKHCSIKSNSFLENCKIIIK